MQFIKNYWYIPILGMIFITGVIFTKTLKFIQIKKMPKALKLLLKQNKAIVVKKTPFTIKLNFGSSGYKQDITLGVDAGSKVIGLSATTPKKVLFEDVTYEEAISSIRKIIDSNIFINKL